MADTTLLRQLLADLPRMQQDSSRGSELFRLGVNGGLDMVAVRIQHMLVENSACVAAAPADRCPSCETSSAPCRKPGKDCAQYARWLARHPDVVTPASAQLVATTRIENGCVKVTWHTLPPNGSNLYLLP